MQLTQKKAALQFKTLDQTLQTFNRDTGQKQALSYRCADIDRIVPSLMGVSKVPPVSRCNCSCINVLLAEADIQLAIIIRQAVDTDQLAKLINCIVVSAKDT